MKVKYQIASFKSEEFYFWRDSRYISGLLAILKKYGLLNSMRYFGDFDRMTEIESLENIAEDSVNWEPGSYCLADSPDTESNTILLSTRKPSLHIHFIIDLSVYKLSVGDFIDAFNGVTKELVELFKGVATFWPAGAVTLIDFKFPQIRPKRYCGSFGGANIVDYLSPKSLQEQGHPYIEKEDDINKLTESELPPGVKREIADDLITIQWLSEGWSDEDMRKAMMQREEWLYRNIDFEMDEMYNEAGDYREFYLEELPDKKDSAGFFNSYDSVGGVGFKTVLTTAEGDIDEYVSSEISRLLSQGALDDGSKLSSVKLIVPNRDLAVKSYPKAREIGVDTVYYTGSEGSLWDISPAGLWREL